MPRPHPPRRATRAGAPTPTHDVEVERLGALADVLVGGVPLQPGDPPRIVRLRAEIDGLGDDEVELGVRELEPGAHPIEVLVGWTAPADWAVIGVVTTGRGSIDGAPPFPLRSAHVVARSGAWAASWQPLGAGSAAAAGSDGGPGGVPTLACGRIDDALRRALGLPTAPPPDGTHVLWATQWLDALVEQAAGRSGGGSRRPSLASLVGLHPAVAAFDLDPSSLSVRELVAEADRLAGWRGWTQLRYACAGRMWSHPEVDATTAAWLDDGAFARWVLAAWPDLRDLRQALDALLASSALGVVGDALDAWGLTETSCNGTT